MQTVGDADARAYCNTCMLLHVSISHQLIEMHLEPFGVSIHRLVQFCLCYNNRRNTNNDHGDMYRSLRFSSGYI